MGAGRRPILPAPTDSSAVESTEEPEDEYTDTGLGTDLATDLTTRTDSTSKTIPADGTPITIPTGQSSKRSRFGKLSKTRNKSHTSLLIEYFEEGPDGSRQPSVRVKIPESARRSSKGEEHIVITDANGTRKVSRNISLKSNDPARITNPGNFSSLASLEGHQRTGPDPIEVELLGKEGSEISQLSEARYIEPTSDISSMPANSLLDGQTPRVAAVDPRDRSISREDDMDQQTLQLPRQPHAQNPTNRSTERLTQKVIEKIQNKPRTTSSTRRRHGEKTSSRSRSVSKTLVEGESMRRSGKGREDTSLATESSLASNSLLSANPKSLDAGSVRSGTSQGSSITNPRLLHTVEDAIRRLILPELNEMKNQQRKISGSKRYDKHYDPSDLSESSISREENSRRVSKRSTSDNPKIIRSGSRDADEVLSSGKRRHRKHKDGDRESPSERSYRRRESIDSVSVDDTSAKSSKHRHRDLAASALVGGVLTAAALKHHESDSRSDVDRRERRKKHRSKSRSSKSRSASIAESDDVFHKHEVPPMPMRSDIGSELTRSSLLSEKTADTMTPPRHSMREVARGSPREVSSPTSSTPKQTPGDQKRTLGGLGMYHSNFSDRNLSGSLEEHHREAYSEENTPSKWGSAGAGAAGAGIAALTAQHFLEDPERAKAYEANLHHQHPIRRGLSPIQSVASYQTTEPNRNSIMNSRSVDSLDSPEKREQLLREEPSYNSMSSVNSIDIAKRGQRPLGIHMENPSEVLAPHNDKFETSPDFKDNGYNNDELGTSRDLDDHDYDDDDFYDDQHDQNERFRDSYASSDPKVDVRRMTNYTDDSMDAPYLDKVTAGQQVARGYGANPEYVHTPPGVESAVASLYDPSLVDVRSDGSPAQSYSQSRDHQIMGNPIETTREPQSRAMGSPLKQIHGVASPEPLQIRNRGFVNSPVQSIAESFEQRERDAKRVSQSPVKSPAIQATKAQEQQDATSPESEITTNPSVIQGPIGGYAKDNRDHWPYGATPPTNKYTIQSRDTAPIATAAGVGILGAGGAQAHLSDKPRGLHTGNTIIMPPSPGAEDEGYITGVNPKSPVMYADKTRGLDDITPVNEQIEMPLPGDDPFTAKKGQYLSGFSQGMGSPLYDSSTGQGMDRIQSKDIVALMDHLTVRDAQRNARDTEILVTLVRSAAEMRNNFEDMKKFITDTGDEIMDTGDKQHEYTQKLIGGPRPQPQSNRSLDRAPKSQGYQSDEPSQRKNVFKRALQGLGSKNKAELQNIESMLMQLLDEVEGLRSSHSSGPPVDMMQGNRSINSQENVQPPTDPGYEPEGQAGTSSTGVGNSGFFSNNSSRQDHYRGATGGLRESGNRVSTVMEGDEYEDEAERDGQRTPNQQYPNGAPYGSPSQEVERSRDIGRGQSEPLRTPPRMQQQQEPQVHFSNENTPNLSTSGGRTKYKSTGSSFFPRISRWSKTTASSITDNFRSSGQQARSRPFSEVSRSGENVDGYDYDPQGDDRIRSNTSFANDSQYQDENRPPSPLIPSQVSEKPKYQAVRNSINLEHPQPRQGPTGRYQHHLENEAQTYAGDDLSPTSQTSSHWNQTGHGAINTISNQGYPQQNRELSPVSVGNYSDTSSAMRELGGDQGKPRSFRSTSSRNGPTPPPKLRDDNEPLVPSRPPKVAMTPPANRPVTYAEQVAVARAGSPAYSKSQLYAPDPRRLGRVSRLAQDPLRGVGVIGGGRSGQEDAVQGSPNQIDSDEGEGEGDERFENVVTKW